MPIFKKTITNLTLFNILSKISHIFTFAHHLVNAQKYQSERNIGLFPI